MSERFEAIVASELNQFAPFEWYEFECDNSFQYLAPVSSVAETMMDLERGVVEVNEEYDERTELVRAGVHFDDEDHEHLSDTFRLAINRRDTGRELYSYIYKYRKEALSAQAAATLGYQAVRKRVNGRYYPAKATKQNLLALLDSLEVSYRLDGDSHFQDLADNPAAS